MSFFKYLSDKGIVANKDLIEAVSDQLEMLPSLLRILQDSNLLEESKIIELVSLQIMDSSDLETVIIKKNFLPMKEIKNLYDERERARKPLGQILLEKGIIQKEELEKHLKNYLGDQAGDSESEVPENIADSTSESSEDNVIQISAAALEDFQSEIGGTVDMSEFNVGATEESESDSDIEFNEDESFLEQYLAFKSDENFEKIESLIREYKDNPSTDTLREYFDTLHRLRGICKLSNLQLSEKLAGQIENCLIDFLDNSESTVSESVVSSVVEANSLLLLLSEEIEKTKKESGKWDDESFKSDYLKAIKNLRPASVAAA